MQWVGEWISRRKLQNNLIQIWVLCCISKVNHSIDACAVILGVHTYRLLRWKTLLTVPGESCSPLLNYPTVRRNTQFISPMYCFSASFFLSSIFLILPSLVLILFVANSMERSKLPPYFIMDKSCGPRPLVIYNNHVYIWTTVNSK